MTLGWERRYRQRSTPHTNLLLGQPDAMPGMGMFQRRTCAWLGVGVPAMCSHAQP